MEKISWKEKKTNENVLEMVGDTRKLVHVILERKKNWIGHVLRGDGLLKEVMEGRLEAKRPKGSSRIGMLEELKEGPNANIKRRAENRSGPASGWRNWVRRTC